MDLTIKKDSKARGLYFHKMPRVGASKTKKLAFSDISEEFGPLGFFTQNYIHREAEVLNSLKFDFKYITIDESSDCEPDE
jgi:hypothetical protein